MVVVLCGGAGSTGAGGATGGGAAGGASSGGAGLVVLVLVFTDAVDIRDQICLPFSTFCYRNIFS